MYLAARVPIVLNYNPFMCYKNDDRPEYNDQVSIIVYKVGFVCIFALLLFAHFSRVPVLYLRNKIGTLYQRYQSFISYML